MKNFINGEFLRRPATWQDLRQLTSRRRAAVYAQVHEATASDDVDRAVKRRARGDGRPVGKDDRRRAQRAAV